MPDTEHLAGSVAELTFRLANIQTPTGYTLAVPSPAGLVDIGGTARACGLAPLDMDDLLQNNRAPDVQTVLLACAQGAKAVLIDEREARFGPVVSRPGKIVCVGFNYREHAAETGTPLPTVPPLFAKYNNALLGHDDVIVLPVHAATRFDYETELVIVMGRTCTGATEAEALHYVAGYATGNDFSARDLQLASSQFMLGKTSNGFAPLGPWLTPAALVPDPHALRLRTTVNGETRQDWTTGDMIFDCRALIAFISSVFPLEAGDVIFTGTPQGVILGEPGPPEDRRWLRAGDEIVSSIAGVGDLHFTLA